MHEIIGILIENYSLGELEERLEVTLEDLRDGLEDYVESHYTDVTDMLKEDLFL